MGSSLTVTPAASIPEVSVCVCGECGVCVCVCVCVCVLCVCGVCECVYLPREWVSEASDW